MLTLKLSPTIERQLERYAMQNRKSKAFIAQKAISQYIKANDNKQKFKSPFGLLKGSMQIYGDIVNFDSSGLWEAFA